MRKSVAKITIKMLALFIVMGIAWAQQSVTTIASEIVAQATDEVTGTLGDNGGFKWRFEKSTGTLTITGEDIGFKFNKILTSIGYEDYYCIEKVVFKDCKFIGSLRFLLSNRTEIESVKFVNCDTSQVTDMSGMFYECSSLKTVDMSGMDTSNVIDMSLMFAYCDLTTLDLSGFNTSNVTDMRHMFFACGNLTTLDLSGFDTLNVTDISEMFFCCDELTTIYTPKCIGAKIELPATFCDIGNNSTNYITPDLCNTVLVKNITQQTGNAVSNNKYRIKVKDIYGKPISNATIDCGNYCKSTDSNGEVIIDATSISDNQVITISKDNYLTVSITYGECKIDGGYYETVLYNGTDGSCNLRDVYYYTSDLVKLNIQKATKTLNLKNSGNLVGDLTNGNFKIECVALVPDKVSEYQLWQKNKKIATSTTGVFSLNVDQGFVEGGGCYIKVVSKTGKTENTNINLTFVKNLINDVSSISLMDKKVEFKVADNVPFLGGSNLEVEMPTLPVVFGASDDKVFIGINVKGLSGELDKEYYEDLKKDIKSLKSLKGLIGEKNFKKKLTQLMQKDDNMSLPGGDFDISVVGYAEANWGERIARGEIYIEVTGKSPTLGFNTVVVVVPVTVQFDISVTGKLSGEISYDLETGKFDGNLRLGLEGKLHAFGGVGVGRVIGVGAYGEAALGAEIVIFGKNPGLEKIDLTGQLGLEAYIGPFTYKRPFAYNTWHLYSRTTKKAVRPYYLSDETVYGLTNAENYGIASLDYLSAESDWCGYPIMLNDADANTNFMSLVENTYLNAQPVMVANGDVLYGAFLGADPDTNEIYVQCTKMENGVWCEPVRVDSEAILDNAPQLLVDGEGNIWLAYAKTNENADVSSLLNYAQSQSIVVGTLDKETLAFTEMKVFDNTDYEHMQQFSLVDGMPIVTWVESEVTDDDSVLVSLNNKIVSATYSEGEWSETAVVKSVDAYICDLAVGNSGIAYIMDVDADLDTSDDRTLVYCDRQGIEISTVAGVMGNISYGVLPGETEGTFMWNDIDRLCTFESEIEVIGITNDYVINGNSIYYSTPVEGGAELAVIRRNDDGTYGNPIVLTDTDRYIENLSVATAYGMDIVLGMHTSAEITDESVNTAKNLVWSIVQPVNDIRIDGIDYDIEGATSGENFLVTITVTNAGVNEVTEVKISLDGNTVATETVTLQPGESTDITFEMTYPNSQKEYSIKVEDTASDLESDYNPDNNSMKFKLGYANLKVDASLRKIGASKTIVSELVNNGTGAVSGTIALFDEKGKLLSIQSFTDLSEANALLIEMPLSEDVNETTLSVVVTTNCEELYTHDNTDTVYVLVSKYEITYELDGGVQNKDNPEFYYESEDALPLLSPTKENYTFGGWYSDSEYTTKVEEIEAGYTNDITLYAKWLKVGMHEASDGNYYYYVDDEVDTSLNGLTDTNIGCIYLNNGMFDMTYTGVSEYENDLWYVKEGVVDTTYTDLYAKGEDQIYFIAGKHATEYTGVVEAAGETWYVKDGVVDPTYTDLYAKGEEQIYIVSGKHATEYTGVVEAAGETWYVKDGVVDTTYTGLYAKGEDQIYIVAGKHATEYTGLVEAAGETWYVKDGVVDPTYTDLYAKGEEQIYIVSGKHATEYTGLVEAAGETWYVNEGIIDTNYTGLCTKADEQIYIVSGKQATEYTGLVEVAGEIWYIKNGVFDATYTGLCVYKGKCIYVNKGKFDATYTGLAKNAKGVWYIKNGVFDATYTGMAKNAYGLWYIKEGKFDTTYTGLCVYKGKCIYVNKGKFDATYTGLAKNAKGVWYIKNGVFDATYTGMVKNAYGLWYIKEGKFDTTYTGLCVYKSKCIYVMKGKFNTTYTGIAENAYGKWYMQNGVFDSTFSGKVVIDEITYNIVNGKVE